MTQAPAIQGAKVDPAAIQALRARVRGEVIEAHEAPYEAARMVLSAEFDRRPAVIVRCATARDVIAAVEFAREHDLLLAVRSGGHSFAGYGICDGGLVIDCSAMKGLQIDPERQVAVAQPGLTWGEYAQQAAAYGLATSAGDTATVGIGGLALGGGIGWMVRKQGLTIDNVRAVELVTADGRLLRASTQENPDLFWALRGGGGNFGVATAFEFQLHPDAAIVGGVVFYPFDEAKRILQAAVAYASTAPDELTIMAYAMHAPPAPFIPPAVQGQLVVALVLCYAGAPVEAEQILAPLRQLATPIVDTIGPMPYPGLFAITEQASIPGLHHADRSEFLCSVDEQLLGTVVDQIARSTSPFAMAQLRVLGGAMARVPADATAFAHRDKPYMLTVINAWSDPAQSERERGWTDGFFQAVRPYAAGVYANFLGDEGEARIHEAYPPETYTRLAAIKRRYDPTNVFRLNQNIPPLADALPFGARAARDEDQAAD